MKLFKFSSLLLLVLTMSALLSSCEKDEEILSTGLSGTWKLTESYVDPGDGSGKYKKVSGDTELLLIISDDGKISGNQFLAVDSYKVLKDPDRLEVFFKSDLVNPRVYFYKLSGNSLEITGGGCIEGCGMKYVRIK